MAQKLITQLENVCLRRQRQRWLVVTICAVVAVAIAVVVLIAFDYAFGVTDPLARRLSTTLLVVVGVLTGSCWVRIMSATRESPLQIALEIERQRPELQDLVSSAWDFEQQMSDDPVAGSESLRRAVVNRASVVSDHVDWQQLVSCRSLKRALLALATVVVTVGSLTWCLPQEFGIGLTRLVNPLSTAEWPREHNLQFIEPPLQLAAGDDLVLRLRDTGGILPSTVTIHYRSSSQGESRETSQQLSTKIVPVEIRLANVQQSLQFRATGGDHQTMPWQSLEVVIPPRVDRWQFTVHPPAYTALPPQTWDQERAIFAGSRLELQGHTDQPVVEVELRSATGRHLAATVGSQGRSFRVEPTRWHISKSETWTPYLTTATGLEARSTIDWALDVVVDQPPEIRFIEPTSDLTVLPSATIPLVIEAIDEVALREIGLVIRRSDRSKAAESRIQLWHSKTAAGDDSNVVQQRVSYSLDLQSWSLAPGSVVELRAEATDHRPSQMQPVAGQSVPPLKIRIVSEQALWRQIIDQQSKVLQALADLLRRQRSLATLTAEWTEFPQWSQDRRASASQAALLSQRQIASDLGPGRQTLIGQLHALTQTIQRNGLSRHEQADRLQHAQDQLQALVDVPLAALERSLGEIARQAFALDQTVVRPHLIATAELQAEVVAALSRVVDLLLPGDVLGQLEAALRTIEKDQFDLAEHCRVEVVRKIFQAESATSTVAGMVADAASRQRELADRLASILLDLAEAAEQMANDDASIAARLADTLALAETLGLQLTIQEAAEELVRQRLGRATTLQQQTLTMLSKLLLRLSGEDTAGASEHLEQLRLVERELESVRRRLSRLQQELSEGTAADPQGNREGLRHQRRQLADATDRLALKLDRLQTPDAAAATREASSKLRHADLGSKSTQQAQQYLAKAQRELAAQRRQRQVALARLQLADLDRKLRSLIARQQTVRSNIRDLDSVQKQTGRWSDAQQQRLEQITERQADCRLEVTTQAQQLFGMPVFTHLLGQCGISMQAVESRLQRQELGPATQVVARQVVEQLTLLADAIRQEMAELAANRADATASSRQEGRADDTAQLQTLQLAVGQLKLLKLLQSMLQQETESFEAQQTDGESRADLIGELAREQQQLTDLARQLNLESSETQLETPDLNLQQELPQSLEGLRLPRVKPENQP